MTQHSTINALLVANRGEIALRVMRSAREAGVRTIAVYSEADAQAPHVQFADESVCIGPAPVAESYLRGDVILQAALDRGADAIHPGYGFLSENSGFAEQVAAAGLIFVGPSAEAIDVMGDKARAKRRMLAAGVPCIPGYEDEDQSAERFTAAAAEIGFPVMVKAAAGGGGRGMRLVHSAEELPDALSLARSEAENAFGNGDLILEKAILRPRHVEIQVFADQQGNTLHLGERDCSVQRRHQKIVEESPCPVVTPDLRAAMGAAAIEAARAVSYCGAGTVEFLLDEQGDYYFLEMNTRLQVEHPVTEMVTGLDLVALQLAVAEGRSLPLTQEDVQLDGHAIEVRLYAEDPGADFLPSTGPVYAWLPPAQIRVDAGIASGSEVSPFYDSMVAKLIAHGPDRESARRQLVAALGDMALFGTQNNRDFLIDVLEQPDFVSGQATTALIGDVYGDAGWSAPDPGPMALAIAAVLEHRLQRGAAHANSSVAPELLDWGSARDLATILTYRLGETDRHLVLQPESENRYTVTVDDDGFLVTLRSLGSDQAALLVDGSAVNARFHRQCDGRLFVALPRQSFVVQDLAHAAQSAEADASSGVVLAPMHGQLLEVLVQKGDTVSAGDKLAVLEAMKMQHEILAPIDGAVIEVSAKAGTQVAANQRLLEIE